VIGAFFEVYGELKHGLGETLYSSTLEIAPGDTGLSVEREALIRVSRVNRAVRVRRRRSRSPSPFRVRRSAIQ
jgi:hypothetical protein